MNGNFYSPEFAIARNQNGTLVAFAIGPGFALYANTQTSSGQWSGWGSLGGQCNSNFAAYSNFNPPIGLFVLFVGGYQDDSLYQSTQVAANGSFSGWSGLGGIFSGTPAVAQNQDGRLEVFVRGTDNAVWHNWQTTPPTTNNPNPTWSGWQSLGGAIISDPIAAVNKDGRLEVFVTGSDHGLHHYYQTPTQWECFAPLGGVISDNIAVTANADGHLEVFALIAGGSLWHIYQTAPNASNTWSEWQSLGGSLTGKPVVSKNANGCLEVFVCGADNTLFHIGQTQANDSSSWVSLTSLGGNISPYLEVILTADNCLSVFARGSDSNLHYIQETEAGTGNWSEWSTVAGMYPGMDKSDLSSSNYGYDFVTAVTQDSINLTMKHFLNALEEPVVTVCYVADEKGNPVEIDYATLVKNANGTDPFTVPANTPANDPRITNLFNARFMAGFKAQIGLPLMPLYKVPDIVILGTDTSAVTFNLMCHEFIVVQYTPASGYTSAQWMNVSQPQNDPWLFTSNVDLRLFATDKSHYDKLPPAVQKQIANLGPTAFSVQQLLFDLDNAALETMPTISGVKPGSTLYNCLSNYFLGCYFSAMQAKGAPLLGCTITIGFPDPSTLSLTNINMMVSPLVGPNGLPQPDPTPEQTGLTTLCYLCETNNDEPIPPRPFTWNWMPTATAGTIPDGCMSVNRNTFVNYIRGQLNAYVSSNCLAPWVQVTYSPARWGGTVTFNCTLTPNQTPVVTLPSSGQTILQYAYSNTASDSNYDSSSSIRVSPSFNLSVDFVGNTLVISQHLVVYLYIKDELSSKTYPNLVDVAITDTYTLDVDDMGQLKPSQSSNKKYNSAQLNDSFWDNFGFEDVVAARNTIAAAITAVTSTSLKSLPLSIVQNFVFPGGETFIFDKVFFSDYQDLVATINYASPSAVYRSTLPPKQAATGAAQ